MSRVFFHQIPSRIVASEQSAPRWINPIIMHTDNPIVYVSSGFLELTGYDLDQVLGRNCRFLQGPGTDQSAVDVIRRGVKEGIDTSVCLLNYKKDGTSFWNSLFIASLMDSSGNIVNHISVQTEVQGPPPGDPEFESFKASNVDQGEVDDSFL